MKIQNSLNMIVAIITITGQLVLVIYFISNMKNRLDIIDTRVNALVKEAQKNISIDSKYEIKLQELTKCCDNIKETVDILKIPESDKLQRK